MYSDELVWWYWLLTAVLLAFGVVLGFPQAFPGAIALTALQAIHFALRERSASAFPVQVRIAYLALLLAGMWSPLSFLYPLMLAGTLAMVVFDYCLLARCLSLLPWNRRVPLSWRMAMRTFFSRPMAGRIRFE